MNVADLMVELGKLDPNAKVGVHSGSIDHDVDYIDGASMVYQGVVILSTENHDDEDES